jgi:outer membrane receptor protein involved in Fe transport
LRYLDAVGIGFPVVDDAELGLINDVNNPFFGPDEVKADMWVGYKKADFFRDVDLKVQLNIRNVFDEDALVPILAQPDGSNGAFRIPEGRAFALTTTFEF